MNWMRSTAVCDFRSVRKCFSFSGSLLLMVLLLATQVTSAPQEQLQDGFNPNDEYTDVDNVEIHHVKVVNGVMHEDHPIIMYKEDFVNEDYVPQKNVNANKESKEETNSRPLRKYKDIASKRRRFNHTAAEHYRVLKPEKKLFDILPTRPLLTADNESGGDDNKFDTSKIRVISLADENDNDNDVPSKNLLNKHPKKYHHSRQRRDADEHVLHKRNPYIRSSETFYRNTLSEPQLPRYYYSIVKHQVAGNRHNGLDTVVPVMSFENRFDGPDNADRVIWGRRPASSRRQTSRPANSSPPRTTTPAPLPPSSIFHSSNPEDADFSFYQTTSTTTRPRPPNRPPPSSIFHDSNPENADFSFFTKRPTTPNRIPSTTSPQPISRDESTQTAAERPREENVSQCVWAIVNCCSNRDFKIRYSCFEQMGCHGAFWDLNPCAENIRDNIINYVSDIYN